MARLKATLDLIEGTESKEYYQKRYEAFRSFRKDPDFQAKVLGDQGSAEKRILCYDFLNHYELVAISCREGLIDEAFYRHWMGPNFVRDWNAAAPIIVLARDGEAGTPEAYVSFEALAVAWGGRRMHVPWYCRPHPSRHIRRSTPDPAR